MREALWIDTDGARLAPTPEDGSAALAEIPGLGLVLGTRVPPVSQGRLFQRLDDNWQPIPRSAPCSRTALIAAARFSGNNGLGTPLGKLPSGS